MIDIDNEEFQELINQALLSLPGVHAKGIKNVAILYEEEPTPEQRAKTNLKNHQTLLGLYEGVPLSQRQGHQPLLPDKITLFKGPLTRQANTLEDLKKEIRHTLWHEIAHYYGLDHKAIHGLE
ncbi:metallopeptidase family protein [bacterium]|jgi:predicted Zn-dependent protease with MMP-like domain|nr:metallopeptidase family protein [bacterium]